MADKDVQLDEKTKEMIEAAQRYRRHAYCPYSDFRVGASVLTSNGNIFSGCNVENVCYGLTVCAERVAIMNAVSEGHTQFQALAVCCDAKNSFKASCGACRQFIAEFASELDLYLVDPSGIWKMVKFSELLPMPFTPASLQAERDKS